jgi:hypothetical protein
MVASAEKIGANSLSAFNPSEGSSANCRALLERIAV